MPDPCRITFVHVISPAAFCAAGSVTDDGVEEFQVNDQTGTLKWGDVFTRVSHRPKAGEYSCDEQRGVYQFSIDDVGKRVALSFFGASDAPVRSPS